MITAVVPPSVERARTEALHRFGILDTPAEQAFDDLTALAAQICDTRMSTISMIDIDRQWFKSRLGVEEKETRREISFCEHALAQPDVMVVDDLAADPRFESNPMVVGGPKFRFYAGAPLITGDGIAIGTLCVLDVRPRTLRSDQRDALQMLARLVMSQLELRLQSRALVDEVAAKSIAQAGLLGSERRFRTLFDHSPVGMGLSDEQGAWVEVNPAFAHLLGVQPSDMVGATALDFVHPDDRELVRGSERGQLSSPDGVWRFELRFVRPDGTVRWAWISLTPTPGPASERWTLGTAQDITDRKAAEEALRHSEEELAAVAAVARCTQSGADPRPVIVTAVRSLADASSVRLLEPAGRDRSVLTAHDRGEALLSPGDLAVAGEVRSAGRPITVTSPMAQSLWQPVVVEGEVIAVLHVTWTGPSDGPASVSPRSSRAVRVLADEAGASLHAAQLRFELERSAATDPLTGALNRRAWETRLSELMHLAARSLTPLTVALIDLDNFKSYNDSHGHAAGDDLLREFADRVRSGLRAGDLFARWGGEEFILALTDCDGPAAGPILDRIRCQVPGDQTCSMGHTVWDTVEDVSVCVGRADLALYAAKRAGRDRIVLG